MHPLRPAQKSRAIHHIRAAFDDRLQQLRVIARIVFQVRVLHQHDISRYLRKTAPQSSSLTLVRRLKEKPQISQLDLVAPILRGSGGFAIRLLRSHVFEYLTRSVGRAIIDDDHFLAYSSVQHPPEDLIDRRFLVVNGNNNGNLRIVQRRGVVSLMGHGCRKIVAAHPPASKGKSCPNSGLGCYRSFRTPPNPLSLYSSPLRRSASFTWFLLRG